MKARVQEKTNAIHLRKSGKSYGEILKTLRVSKSTLSLWLKELPLTKKEKRYLKKRRNKNISLGRIRAAATLTENRLKRERIYVNEAQNEFKKYAAGPGEGSFLLGVALYWAEGSKRTTTLSFTNSDYKMIRIFVAWAERFLGVSRDRMHFRLYTHRPFAHENQEGFWAGALGVQRKLFKKTVYKSHGGLSKKRPNYKGCLRVSLPCSKKFLQKVLIWQDLLYKRYSDMRP